MTQFIANPLESFVMNPRPTNQKSHLWFMHTDRDRCRKD